MFRLHTWSFPCFYRWGLAGQNYTFSGYVQDRSSGEKLIAATVYDLHSGKGTSANEYGFYSLTLPAGELQLQVSYVGYSPIGYL